MSKTNEGDDDWTPERMYAVGVEHATIEAAGDLEGTMATVVDDPVYEFLPAGRRMRGTGQVRRYYENLIENYMPRQLGYEMVGETLSAEALAQEYVVEIQGDDGPERHRILGILFRTPDQPDKLAGERIWGSEHVLRKMVGPVWDELEIIPT